MGTADAGVELAALDLDGTLLRGDTVCEGIARHLGKLERMRELEQVSTTAELLASREEMGGWYQPYSVAELSGPLAGLELAPGAREALELFRDRGVTTAIVSLTWDFAVEYFADELGADYHVGTVLGPDGDVTHFLPEDKPVWVRELAEDLEVGMEKVISFGDTASDAQMLNATGHGVFVGDSLPDGLDGVRHVPEADLHEVAIDLLDAP